MRRAGGLTPIVRRNDTEVTHDCFQRDAALDRGARPARDPPRNARVRRRRTSPRDRRARVRPPRLPSWRQRVSRRLSWGIDVRDPEGIPRRGRRRQPGPHLLGAAGLGVGVPDRERRHGLLHGHHRSHVGADGRRDAAAGTRDFRRHVVGLDHRLRPTGPGSRRGRPLPARPARLRRPAAGQRLPRRTLAHVEGAHGRPVVPDRQRPSPHGRDDSEHAEALPLRARCLRHEHRDAARGWRRAPRAADVSSRDGVRGGKRAGVQHGAAERLRLLRADERGGAGRSPPAARAPS